jgi:flagellin
MGEAGHEAREMLPIANNSIQQEKRMALSVLNNISAMYAENNLNQTQASLQNTLTQLSSGSRINSGSDDAAGLSVADGLSANEAALTQSAQNASDGVSLLQTADGALSQVNNLLNRAVTLATESANGTLNSSQVSSANAEYQNILTEIGNIGSTTNFNGDSVFTNTATNLVVSDGTSSGTTTFADVVGSLTKGSIGLSAAATTPGTSSALAASTSTASSGTTASTTTLTLGATGNTVGGTLSLAVGAGASHSIIVAAGSSLSDIASQINSDSTYQAASVSAAYDSTTGVLTISGPAAAASTLSTTGTSLTQTTAGTTGTMPGVGVDFTAASISSLTAASAQTVLTSLTAAIGDVAYQRGIIGANVNQLNAASQVASSESENLTAASSAITSTDYGQATSDMAKYQVLSQTGISALAQANSVQQEVLKLLQ